MNRLAYWRATKGLTVRELAKMAGVSSTTINRLERGHIKSGILTLGKLAKGLQIDVTELAELAENPNSYALDHLIANRAQELNSAAVGTGIPSAASIV